MNKPSVSAGVVAGVALGAAALGAAAVAVRAACLQVARTRNGLARVKRVHDEGGDEIRVLVQGGVYQSASYVGERWAEPVFAYYRAFDDVFESEDAMRDAYGHGIDRMLMLGGGGVLNWSFIQAGMCDEVSVVIAPVADGSSKTPALFNAKDEWASDTPVAFELQSAEIKDGGSVWLRYLVKR